MKQWVAVSIIATQALVLAAAISQVWEYRRLAEAAADAGEVCELDRGALVEEFVEHFERQHPELAERLYLTEGGRAL